MGILALSVLAAPAHAEDPTSHVRSAERQATALVEVCLVGRVGDDRALRQVLEEWLGSNGIEFVVTKTQRLRFEDVRAPRTDGPPIRMWIVAVGTERARLYFAEPDSGRYLVRDVPVPTGFDEVGRERIAQIVLSSALAFIEEGVGSPLQEVERTLVDGETDGSPPLGEPVLEGPSPLTESPRRPRSCLGYGMGVRYAAIHQGRAGVAQGPGLQLELTWGTARLRGSLGAFVDFRVPHGVTTGRVHLDLGSQVVGGGMGARVHLGGPAFWWGQIGGGVEAVRLVADSRSESVQALGTVRDTRPFLFFGLGPSWELRALSVATLLRVDAQPVGVQYEIEGPNGRFVELSPPRLQPGAFAVVSWHRTTSRGAP